MIPYQISDANLAQSLQNGQLQQTHLDFRMEGGKVQVTENQQFKKEMEQNIYNHFNFMLRIAFYQGVFDEITNFIGIYQQQFANSTELYEYWKEIDKITDSVALQVLHAEQRIEMIEQYKRAPVQMEEFNEFKKQMSFAFLDKEFRIQTALQNQEEEKARAEFEADAITTFHEGTQYLKWLKIQKPKQQQFKEELDEITQLWNDQYQIFVAGRTFIENIDRNQVAIFTQKSWESDNWISQLQNQIHNAIPLFEKLYDQYLKCLQYYLNLSEFKDNVLINQEIKENLIETAIRIAEKPFILSFLKHFQEKEKQAIFVLSTYQSIDQTKRLQQVSRNQNELIFKIERAFNNLDISVSKRQDTYRNSNTNNIHHQIEYVSDVTLRKENLNLYYENPDKVEWDPKTLEQMEILNQIQQTIKQLISKLDRLDFLQNRYEELKQLPQQIALKYKQEFEIQIQQREIKKAQFCILLKQSECEKYDSLTYQQQSMPLLLGALSKNIVIKRNSSCMCCSRQPPHNSDDLFYEDYVKVVASEIRNMKNLENKWLISNEERIMQTKDLPVLKSASTFILNHSILGALRNDNGSRQIKNRQREFYPYASIAKTIYQLCHLVIVDQKKRLNLTSATVNEKILNWTMTLQDAKIGKLATNYSLPINGQQ